MVYSLLRGHTVAQLAFSYGAECSAALCPSFRLARGFANGNAGGMRELKPRGKVQLQLQKQRPWLTIPLMCATDIQCQFLTPHTPFFRANAADVVIVAAARTPLGCFQGCLSCLSGPQLGAAAIRGALHALGPDKAQAVVENVDEVLLGNVLSANLGQVRP